MWKHFLFASFSVCSVLSADFTWTTPGQLTPGAVYSSVTTTYDPTTGTLIALWQNSEGNYYNYSSTSADHGLSWTAAQQMSNDLNYVNNVYGVYAAYSGGQPTITATYNGEGGASIITGVPADGAMSWNPPSSIPNVPEPEADVFSIFAAQPSSLFVSFSSSDDYTPYFAATNDGSSWNNQQISADTVNEDVFISYNPSTGSIVATWTDTSGILPYTPVSSTSEDLGTTWSSPPTSIGSVDFGSNVTVSYNSVYNTTIAAWGNREGDAAPQFAVSIDDGTSWPTSVTLSSDVYRDVYTAVDPVTGITMATWTGASENFPYYSFSQDGGMTWSPALAIGTSTVGTSTGEEDVFVSFDPVSRSFIATWANGADNSPWYALFALPPPVPPGIMTNFGGNAGRLAVYLNSLPSSFIAPLTSLTTNQLKKALIEILPKPTTKLSAANTLLVMGDAMEKRMSRRIAQNKNSSLASSLEKVGGGGGGGTARTEC